MSNSKDPIDIKPGSTFNIGERVQKSGMYVCAPCGDVQKLRKNQKFPTCFSCMKEERYQGDKYFKNLGLWELMEE